MTKPKSKLPLKVVSFILCLALFAPVPAHAGLGDLFGAIDSTISDMIGGTLKLITTVQTKIPWLYEEVVWPIGAINSTRTWSRNLVGQYRGWMSLAYHLPIQSAQTMSPQKL